MNSSKFIFLYITLWCCNNAVEVQSVKEKALIFNQKTKQLMELRNNDESAKCTHCITACSLSTEIIRRAAVSGYGILLQEVYNNAENPIKIKTDICDKPMTPSIVYDLMSANFEIGYEMFYKKGQIDLSCWIYNDLLSIIDGEPNPSDRELINDEFITTIHKDPNTTFQIKGNPNETMVFYWISVFTLENLTGNRRHITIVKDIINDYFHKKRVISYCENYYLSVGSKISPARCKKKLFNFLNVEPPSVENRLEKTQIVPMHMFHTLPGRLATCLYANIAFIWSSIANGQLPEVDLFLYTLYKLHPSNINIYFGVKGESKNVSAELTASENPIFRKYPIPEIMYRVVEWTDEKSVVYKVLVVIHNDPKAIKENDRICSESDQVQGWKDIESLDTTATTGTSYTCPMSGETLSRVRFNVDYSWKSFSVDNFPTIDDSDGHVNFIDISNEVRVEFNRLKSLKK